jgi:hypothetical protein
MMRGLLGGKADYRLSFKSECGHQAIEASPPHLTYMLGATANGRKASPDALRANNKMLIFASNCSCYAQAFACRSV